MPIGPYSIETCGSCSGPQQELCRAALGEAITGVRVNVHEAVHFPNADRAALIADTAQLYDGVVFTLGRLGATLQKQKFAHR